jgi:hypothetical protein
MGVQNTRPHLAAVCSPRTCWYHIHTIETDFVSFFLAWLILIARDKPLDLFCFWTTNSSWESNCGHWTVRVLSNMLSIEGIYIHLHICLSSSTMQQNDVAWQQRGKDLENWDPNKYTYTVLLKWLVRGTVCKFN